MIARSTRKLLHSIAVPISSTVLASDKFSVVGEIVDDLALGLVLSDLFGALIEGDLKLVGPDGRGLRHSQSHNHQKNQKLHQKIINCI